VRLEQVEEGKERVGGQPRGSPEGRGGEDVGEQKSKTRSESKLSVGATGNSGRRAEQRVQEEEGRGDGERRTREKREGELSPSSSGPVGSEVAGRYLQRGARRSSDDVLSLNVSKPSHLISPHSAKVERGRKTIACRIPDSPPADKNHKDSPGPWKVNVLCSIRLLCSTEPGLSARTMGAGPLIAADVALSMLRIGDQHQYLKPSLDVQVIARLTFGPAACPSVLVSP
jgi:hypothetical protein